MFICFNLCFCINSSRANKTLQETNHPTCYVVNKYLYDLIILCEARGKS